MYFININIFYCELYYKIKTKRQDILDIYPYILILFPKTSHHHSNFIRKLYNCEISS